MKPKEGWMYVRTLQEAATKAAEFKLQIRQWVYVDRPEMIRGVELPRPDKFFFVNHTIDHALILSRVRG